MIWLIISILSSSGLFLIFTHMGRLKVRVLPVIVVNYWTCFVAGNLIPGHAHVFQSDIINQSWFWPVLAMGFLFISGFYSMGAGTAVAGAAPASVAAKMSVVIPAGVAILWLSESPGWLQISGMVLSFLSVFLMTEPHESGKRIHRGLFILILIFITSGAVDTGLSLITHFYASTSDPYTLSTLIFGSAGILGTTLYIWGIRKNSEKGVIRFLLKRELITGIFLGLINYVSLISILSGIEHYTGSTAWFFAVNNIGVVALSSVCAALLFSERIHKSGYWGLLLAVIALLLMNWDVVF